ncbi:hypothetical protein ABT354_16735 [Streptomyces sp. NPDC000594]|uniref:hypothetical protein n=1 Tax=Streptomyces sp. NPDC000594 TaxID=3154261 RepID=UPI0033245AE9
MAVIRNKEDEEIVFVPSQMRRIVPRLEEVAAGLRTIETDIAFVAAEPLEGNPANETYQAVMKVLSEAHKVVAGYTSVAEGVTGTGKVVEGMAKAGEMAERTGQEVVIGLSNRIPESAGSTPAPAPGNADAPAPAAGTKRGG